MLRMDWRLGIARCTLKSQINGGEFPLNRGLEKLLKFNKRRGQNSRNGLKWL